VQTLTLPDDWDEMTGPEQIHWLNTGELVALGGKPGAPRPVVIAKKVIETPALNSQQPPKAMEESTTFRGLSKADSGRETAIIAGTVLGGVGYALPYADKVTAYVDKYPPQTILMVIGGLAAVIALYGLWRILKGNALAYEGRQAATGPKV